MAGLPDINLSNRQNPTLSGIRDYISSLAGPEGIYTQLISNTRILAKKIDDQAIQGVLFGICDRIQVMLNNCNQNMQAVPAVSYFKSLEVVKKLFDIFANTLEELDIVYLQNFLDMHACGMMSAQELQDAREIMRSLFHVQEGIAGYFSTAGYVIKMPTIPRPHHPESCQMISADGRKLLPDLNAEFERIFTELQGSYEPGVRATLAASEAMQYFMRNCKALIQATAGEVQAFNVDYIALKAFQPIVRWVVGHVVTNMQERVGLLPKLDTVPPQPISRAPSRAGLGTSELAHHDERAASPARSASRLTVAGSLHRPVPQRGASSHLQVQMPPIVIQFDAPPGSRVEVERQVSAGEFESVDTIVRDFQTTVRVRVETPKPRLDSTK